MPPEGARFPPAGPSLEDRNRPIAIEGHTHDFRDIGPLQQEGEEGTLYYDPYTPRASSPFSFPNKHFRRPP